MKKSLITITLLFIIIYPPHISTAENHESVAETRIHYLLVKNEVLKYQLTKKINSFYDLYHSIKKFQK